MHRMYDTRVDRYREKIVVPARYRVPVLRLYHSTSWGHHTGSLGLYRRIAEGYYWPRMSEACIWWVRTCIHCKKAKQVRRDKVGLL